MTKIRLLFAGHLMALAFGLGGLLIALPHPELWAGSPMAARVFSFGMTYAGSLHILLGAATMLAFGVLFLGLRRTLIFFVTTVCFSLSAELIGTGTGWPFGNYAYTSGLGFKVLGRVPFTIPLSWFLVGFSAYLLGTVLAGTRFSRHRTVAAIAVGAYLLTVWDLVLDPAMASPDLPIKFWNWFESGPYYGMPIQNFAGWTLTGVLFMTVSRLLWRHDASPREFPAWVPLGVYLANMGFAIALSLSVRIWEPVIAAILLGCIPALLAWRSQRDLAPRSTEREGQARPSSVSQNVMRLLARAVIGRKLTLTVEGAANVPESGPVMLVSRHYHHLYDGCALVATSRRPLHILVGLDWIESRPLRLVMERLCKAAQWPALLRPDNPGRNTGKSAYRPEETTRYLLRSVRESVDLLRAGNALVVFPEGYPVVEPGNEETRGPDELLQFRHGFLRLVEQAQRNGPQVPIVPVGMTYQTGPAGRMVMRFGTAINITAASDRERVLREVEQAVRTLSKPVTEVEAASFQEAIQL